MAKTKAVPDLLRAGLTVTAISRQLGISRQTVYNVKKKLELTGSADRKPGSGRKKSVRVKSIINKVKQRIQTNPIRSMRRMAADLKISNTSMRRIVKNDFQTGVKIVLNSFRVPLLTHQQKETLLERAKAILKDLKHAATGRTILFTDEKIFTVNAAANRRNDRWIGNDPQNCSEGIKHINTTKHPASVMMFGLVASDGQKMPPVFTLAGVKVNTEADLDILSSQVKPWLEAHYPDGNYIFQQDGAPAHTRNLAAYWPKKMWPPQSPDLNPLDYSVWATVEKEACNTSHASVQALKASVKRTWQKMTLDYIKKTCLAFRRRVEAVIRAKGGNTEH
uniref:Tc1-like transposase DDE domain-containing protein n=1 Tax=Acanthochromis polyacanthus TaxID=80966 RepID=A0A3Q1HRU9_9TELE